MDMASKPFLGFATAEGGGFEVAIFTLEYNLAGRTVKDSLLLVLNFARGLLTLVWWVVTSHHVIVEQPRDCCHKSTQPYHFIVLGVPLTKHFTHPIIKGPFHYPLTVGNTALHFCGGHGKRRLHKLQAELNGKLWTCLDHFFLRS